jgi:tRNA-2-methylthio-N6-dimethylallyladenosine synthase
MDERESLCNHVHLPVQSGSSRVLKSMQRLYTRDEYMRRIEWMKNSRRNISITTDIIVGFPGETEADFQQTLDLLDQVEYDSLFSFKYSPRPNTAALGMEDAVPEEEKTRRIMIVQEKQRAIQIRHNAELIGSVEEVMVEGQNEALGQWIGRTSQNRTLNFVHPDTGGASLVGQYLPVRVTRAGPNSLVGEALASVV